MWHVNLTLHLLLMVSGEGFHAQHVTVSPSLQNSKLHNYVMLWEVENTLY